MYNKINVYSEIGQLKKVLVHTPGDEISYVTPQRLDELLFSAILDPVRARAEHEEFVKILEGQGVEVVQLSEITAETYAAASEQAKEAFLQQFLDESVPALSKSNRKVVYDYLKSMEKEPVKMIRKMMAGILAKEVNVESAVELIVDPMPNLYFTRDPFASVGNGVTIHHMYRETRRRETIFCTFVFNNHPEYKTTPKYYNRTDDFHMEGGDVFVYNDKTLVVGVSERTQQEAIQLLAERIKANKEVTFDTIYAINVPKMSNLMHLDTWLTMLDTDKFLYSPNMMSVLKIWEIDLTTEEIVWKEINEPLAKLLSTIIGKEATVVPVAGHGASQIDIDIETNFDATNYVAVAPGVVVGYDRNRRTNEALKAAGITVLSWNGDQLSLGMGSARCMTMPLYREPVSKK
ncbi:arginine deiminase family protein [Ureaplasma ceti]|uniref:Arginine deiminase n=1 Tax=Ureaplasma ceti TaxID=3119530 RepID=A0ABP9UAZ4_9BACT